MAEEKKAKKVYTLEEIKFNEANKTTAILACIPVVGLVLLLTEKDDLFVRYNGAQYTILAAIELVVSLIPVIGWTISEILSIVVLVLIIMGIVKISKGERFDIPVISDWALKLMAVV
jgi:uncharacterized membrane protein